MAGDAAGPLGPSATGPGSLFFIRGSCPDEELKAEASTDTHGSGADLRDNAGLLTTPPRELPVTRVPESFLMQEECGRRPERYSSLGQEQAPSPLPASFGMSKEIR